MFLKLCNIWHILVFAAELKAEYAGSEGSQEVGEVKEMGEVSPLSERNGEDSERKQVTEQDENGGETSISTFSYDQLKAKSDNPVTGIDFKRREVCPYWVLLFHFKEVLDWYSNIFLQLVFQAYLSDEEFQTIFGMTKEAFYKLPKWKQDMQKKKVDLF